MDRLEALSEELAGIIAHSDIPTDPKHSLETREWLLRLRPDASEELQIAALAHDVDRAVPPRTHKLDDESYDDFKARHAKRSAILLGELMRKHGYGGDSIGKATGYVERHEVGGDEESDTLMDADSISYFVDNIDEYFRKNGPERTKQKIAFMYDRATPRARTAIAGIAFRPEIATLMKEVTSGNN